MLSPPEGVKLDSEDSATGMVCAELVSPNMVERSVNLTFTFMAITAGMNKWGEQHNGRSRSIYKRKTQFVMYIPHQTLAY